MADAEKIFGTSEKIQMIDDNEEFQTTMWHYWSNGFTLFFGEPNNQLFNCVEINNIEAQLWKNSIFDMNEKKIIDLFKSKGILQYETEHHDWGEKRLSFDDSHLDFYFEKNKLISIHNTKAIQNSHL